MPKYQAGNSGTLAPVCSTRQVEREGSSDRQVSTGPGTVWKRNVVKSTGPHREVLIEMHQVGKYVRVSAIDPLTLTEVSIVGDPRSGKHILEQTAVRKLRYVLSKKNKET